MKTSPRCNEQTSERLEEQATQTEVVAECEKVSPYGKFPAAVGIRFSV